jgi:pSer/pThr/pTyr-binding forkhead associated (FHA) protein
MLLSFNKKDGTTAKFRVREVSNAPPITLGRDATATVHVDDPLCSRIHAAIRFWDDMFVVRDMNSQNGTFLNGSKILISKLTPGDVIKIGNTELHCASEGGQTDVTMMMKPGAKS